MIESEKSGKVILIVENGFLEEIDRRNEFGEVGDVGDSEPCTTRGGEALRSVGQGCVYKDCTVFELGVLT